MDAGCDEDLLVVATASVGFLVILNNLASCQAVLKLDINNAFNGLHCDIILTAVKNHLPHLHNCVELYFAEPSISVIIIMSEGGAQHTRISAILLGNTINYCRQTVVRV